MEKSILEQANDLISRLNKEYEYTDSKCRLMCYEAAKMINNLKILIGSDTGSDCLELEKWRFVPDDNGGHMLDIHTGIKWYPENN